MTPPMSLPISTTTAYSRKTSYNQWLATDKQEIRYRERVSQGERKPLQMEDTRVTIQVCMLTLHILFYA